MSKTILLASALVLLAMSAVGAGEKVQPMPIPSWNMVNLVERGLPTSWSVEENKLKNIKWSAPLGIDTQVVP